MLSPSSLELLAQVFQSFRTQLSLVHQMFCQQLDDLDLLLWCKRGDRSLYNASRTRAVHGDEALVVHKGEKAHDKLAVHAVSHATVSGDRVTKVLDVECALQARSEEAAEGCDERGECRHDEDVELHWRDRDGGWEVRPVWWDEGKGVDVRDEDWIRLALEAGEDVGT